MDESPNMFQEIKLSALNALFKLRKTLASKDVKLLNPNFEKDYELTTHACGYSIRAALSQENKPISSLPCALDQSEGNVGHY